MIASAITKTEENQLKFFFTPQGFTMDSSEEQIYDKALDKWVKKFKKDKFQAVYDVGFEKKPSWLDQTGQFLYMVADAFQKCLTRQPDLELKRV